MFCDDPNAKFGKVGSRVCDLCLGTMSYFDMSREEAKKDPATFKTNRCEYSDKTQGGTVRAPKRKREREEKIESIDKDSIVAEADLGRLWPIAVLKQHKPDKKYNRTDIEEIKHKGKMVKGIILGKEEGWRPGCLDLKEVSENTVQRSKKQRCSEDDTTDQLDAAWSAAVKSRAITMTPQDNGDGNEVFRLKHAPATKRKKTDSDESSENLYVVYQTPNNRYINIVENESYFST